MNPHPFLGFCFDSSMLMMQAEAGRSPQCRATRAVMPIPAHAALQHQSQQAQAAIHNSLETQSPSRRHVMPCSGHSQGAACATKAAIAHAALQQPHAVQQARMPGPSPVEHIGHLYAADQPSPVHQCHLGTAAQEGQEWRGGQQKGADVSRSYDADVTGTVPAMRYCLSSSEPAHGAGIWEEQTTRCEFSHCLMIMSISIFNCLLCKPAVHTGDLLDVLLTLHCPVVFLVAQHHIGKSVPKV